MNDSTNPIDSKKFLNSNASHLLFQRAFGRPGGLKPRAHDKGARFPLGTIYEYRKGIVRNQRKRRREKKGQERGSRNREQPVWPGPPFNQLPSSPLGRHAWPGRASEQFLLPRCGTMTEDLKELAAPSSRYQQ